MESHQQICGTLLLPDGAKRGVIRQVRNRIASVEILDPADPVPPDTRVWPGLIAPGFFDLHVHGGSGHDFMDGTREAFEAVCRAPRGCWPPPRLLPTRSYAVFWIWQPN